MLVIVVESNVGTSVPCIFHYCTAQLHLYFAPNEAHPPDYIIIAVSISRAWCTAVLLLSAASL